MTETNYEATAAARPTERAEHAPLVRVAVDAMGGDNAPGEIVLGAVQAAQSDPNLEIRLVGKPDALESAMMAGLVSVDAGVRHRITTLIAAEVVEMDDHAAASVRRKQDSSIRVAARLVADGRADAVVSAGNSGGGRAAGLFQAERVPRPERAASGARVPGTTRPTFQAY